MTKRMLIDSTHAEETRVVVLDGNRLEEFDLETSTKHQLKGNIYLAKIVRVEPSLQAAFVEYGGNRHGFLAFGEIHPDYYQIPVADRRRLIEAQEQEALEDEEEADREAEESGHDPDGDTAPTDEPAAQPMPIGGDILMAPSEAADLFEPIADAGDMPGTANPDPAPDLLDAPPVDPLLPADMDPEGDTVSDVTHEHAEEALAPETAAEEPAPPPEQIGGEHDTDDGSARRATSRFLRHYKIQEVIRRRQIMLVQVVKEERGSKGAALTTYISLAGRFSVLMPNSPRGGGISRKITSAADRRRLKEVTTELDLPRGMGLIVRTAGANRPKPEILRDCEYLLDQWDQVRDLTMKSTAPALIYEEASLIKRAIRDVYSRDVDEILVDGDTGWRAARDFMRMLMPTHARKVQLWKDAQPLFAKAQVEQQLEAMLAPAVQLKSGGYLVINQTEALVAIDVNSGRSTRERGIEETALRTNLEAAEEAARQLRLRDLAGLIVIDFIDMESRRNVAAVERRLKDALKTDRARIQVGGISHFGLLEMSRQRLRPSLAETNFVSCPHCGGSGLARSTESAALYTLRAIEEEGGKRRAAEIVVHCAGGVAIYILNHKRQRLTDIEARHAMLVTFVADDSLLPPALRIERVRAQTASEAPVPVQQLAPPEPFEDPDELVPEPEEEEDEEVTNADAPADETGDQRRGRRRRRRRGGAARDDGSRPAEETEGEAVEAGDAEPAATIEPAESETPREEATAEDGERRRRGRRGGRRRRREGGGEDAASAGEAPDAEQEQPEPAPAYVSYTGPTPADPFAGASTFDIFDEIELAEEARANASRNPAFQDEPEPDDVPMASALLHEPEPEPVLPASALLAEPESAPEPTAPPVPEPVAAPAPEPEGPVAGPVIQPVLIGAETPATERKRGWWRR